MKNLNEKRVKLLADSENNQPEQYGICYSDEPVNGTVIIKIDEEYIDLLGDDGFREVGLEQVEFLN